MSDGYIGDERITVPDLAEWVVGLRGFARSGHRLQSPFQETAWDRPEMSAACSPGGKATSAALRALGRKPGSATQAAQATLARQSRLPAHVAPAKDCHCGVYAYHSDDEHLALHPIIAIIRARGRMIVHPRGFRAEHMEVMALAFDPELGDSVEDQRIREVVRRACAWWRIPLLGREQLVATMGEFGSAVPLELRPPDTAEAA
jgi:hypothetical protein